MEDKKIKPNQIYKDVKIESVGERGDGVTRINNFVIFVKGAEIDCTYDIKIKKVFNKYAFAELEEQVKY